VTDSAGKLTSFEYDAFGNLSKTTDPSGNEIVVKYDKLGRKTELRDPDLGVIKYELDPLGQLVSQTSSKQALASQKTRFEYDALGRMTARYETDLESHWVYDTATKGVGALAEAYTGTAALKDYQRRHEYDAKGRPSVTVQTVGGTNFSSKNVYDSWGRLIQQAHQRGAEATAIKPFDMRYNGMGYLERVERNGLELWKVTAQDAANRITAVALGNGLTQTREYYEGTGRLKEAKLLVPGGVERLREGYVYDEIGNVTDRNQYWDIEGFTEYFTYDSLNRLGSSSVNGELRNYTYFDDGRIKSKTGVGSGDYEYPTPGPGVVRPHAVTRIPGLPENFSYDDNGNLTAGNGYTAEWNSFDMPVALRRSGVSSTFHYGSEHQRIKQTRGDNTAVVYAGAQELETRVEAGTTKTTMKTYWPNGIGVEIDKDGETKLYWTHADRLGSTVAISGVDGKLEEKLAYDAWGKRRLLESQAVPNELDGKVDTKGFTGHEMLDQLDLVHMNGRVYDPLIAKFMSGDPIITDPMNGQNYNRYSYVSNNPTNLTDPTGFCETVTGSLICKSGWSLASAMQDVGLIASANDAMEAMENVVQSKIALLSAGSRTATVAAQNVVSTPQAGSSDAANSGTFGEFLGELKPGEFFKQVGRKLLDDFVNNNQADDKDSNALYQWAAGKLEGTYEKPDATSANGTAATVGVAAATLLTPGGARGAIAKEIQLSRKVHGEAAVHAADAIAAGKPSILTIDRAAAPANRNASIGALDKVPAKHLDEYPPAMFKEGGSGASVRAVNPRDNMSAGACIGNACRGLPNGAKVRITVGD